MTKRMSKTLAAEIAGRVMEVVNPQNRGLALSAALRRHGFGGAVPEQAVLEDRAALVGWLLATYSAQE